MIDKKEKIDNLEFERKYLQKGYKYICGVDEVGRGPLSGPVVTAAVIMPLGNDDIIEGVTDSKKLSEKKRIILNDLILKKALAVSINEISNDVIDEINILNATKKSMYSAINALSLKPDVVFIDAVSLDLECETESIIKGDVLSYSIAAASIVAKVYRDNLMNEFDEIYPFYGFSRNKGYGTREHIAAIKERGACKIHRKTFIKNFWE